MPDYRKVQELESARILTEQYYADCVKYIDVKPGSPGVSTSLYYAKDHEDVVHNYIFTTYFTETTYLTIIIDTTWLVEVGRVYTEIDGVMANTCFDGSVGYFSGLNDIARDIRKRLSREGCVVMLKEYVAPEELEQNHQRREQLRVKALHDTEKQSAEQVVCIKINGVNCECCPECGRLASPFDTECHWCFQKLKRGI